MAIETPPVASALAPPVITTAFTSADLDQRWAAWQAKGVAHDRAVARKMAIFLPILIVAAVVIIYTRVGR